MRITGYELRVFRPHSQPATRNPQPIKMENLTEKLKVQLIEQLNLEDLTIEEIGDETPLFGEELGLDSIDALEIIVLLEKEYGLKIESQEEGKKVFQSVKSIAEFIESSRQ